MLGKEDTLETQDKSLEQTGEAILNRNDMETPLKSDSPKKRGIIKDPAVYRWFLTVLVSVTISVLSIFVYDRFFIQKVVSLDVKGFIAEQRDLYLSGKISDEQFRANIDRLEARVKSIPRNRVVIMGDAVIKNAEVIRP